MKNALYLLITSGILLVNAVFADVVINEINYNPPGSEDSAEFVELYNNSNAEVSLAGWKFNKGFDFVFPEGAAIAANGYVVVARYPDRFKVTYPDAPEPYGPFVSGKLSNSGEQIELRNDQGATISSVYYLDGGEWPEEPDGDGPSLELKNPNYPLDNPKVWAASTVRGGTPGAENSVKVPDGTLLLETRRDPVSPIAGETVTVGVKATYGNISSATLTVGPLTVGARKKDGWYVATLTAGEAGSKVQYTLNVNGPAGTQKIEEEFTTLEKRLPQHCVVINEIMHDSGLAASDDDYQYVELYNPTAETVDLKNCMINNVVLDSKSLTIEPGKYLVAPSKKKTITAIYGDKIPVLNCKLKLFGKSGSVKLTDCNGYVISSARYGSDAPWPSLACGTGCSLELLDPSLDGNEIASWGASKLYGTPGKANSAAGDVPALSVVCYPPFEPLSDSPLEFAFAVLGDNVQEVTMNYGMDNASLHSQLIPFDTETGLYKVTLPARNASGTLRYSLTIKKDGTYYGWPQQDVQETAPPATMTARLSYESHTITVEPTTEWQKATITDNASDSAKMYIYMDAAGEILIDEFEMRDGTRNYMANSNFDSNIDNWVPRGNHSGTFWDSTEGHNAKGCLHVVATGGGGGNSSGSYVRPYFSQDLTTGNSYTMSFYYKLPPMSASASAVFKYLTIGLPPETVAISEINYHDLHNAFGKQEYLEFKNYGSEAVDLAGWTLESKEKGKISMPKVKLPAGGFLYLCAATNAFHTAFPSAEYYYDLGFTPDHGSDTFILRNTDGKVIDTASYRDDGEWGGDADGVGASLERLDLTKNGTDPSNYRLAFGGSVGRDANDPRVIDAFHSPAVPTSSSRVYFYCYLDGVSGQPSGNLYYRIGNYGSWNTLPLSYNSTQKRVYCSTTGFSNNDQVSFYYEINCNGKTLTFPAWGASRPCMLEIDDTTDYQIPVYRILMTSENYSKLSSKRLWNNDNTDGTLIIGTNIYYNCGIHYKGNYSRQYRVAHNIRLNYGKKYHKHNKVSNTYNWEDGSPFLAVAYAQRIYRASKTPIYDSEPHLARRMGSLQGLMHSVEGYDDVHLTKLGYDGNCYKATAANAQQAMFSFADYKKETYKDCYEPLAEMNPDRQYKDIATGMEALYIFDNKDYNSRVTNYFDVSAAAKEWCMLKFLNNSDSWTQWGQNYILYGDKKTGRVQLWPQDIGSCVVWGNVQLYPITGGIERFCRHPAVMRAFYAHMTNMVRVLPVSRCLDIFDDLRDQCSYDARRSDGSYTSEAQNLRNTISSWQRTVNSSVGSPTYITNFTYSFVSLPPRSAMVGETYYYRPFAFDPRNRRISYSVQGCDNLKIDSDGLISGVFTEPGTYSCSVRANNGVRTLTQSFSIAAQYPSLRLSIPMEEGSGTTVSDKDGKMTGAFTGDVKWDDNGRYGKCLAFGPSNEDYVQMGSHSDINIAGNFTVEAWVYFTQRNRRYWGRVFKKYEELGWRQDGDSGTHHGGRIAWGPFDNGYSCTSDGFPGGDSWIMDRYNTDDNQRILEPNQWHHFAVTHEKDKNEAYVYVDGHRVSGLVWSGNLLQSSPLFLGGYLNGKLDELKIYSFAKRAYNMGINIEAVQTVPGSQYIQFHTFDRKDGKETNLKYYAIRVMPGEKWYVLPSEKIAPGEDMVIMAEDIDPDLELPPSGSISLYPFEPDSPFPEYYLTNDYTKILDYVAWGDASALPDEKEPAVIAGLWKAGTIVMPKERSFRLKERGQNVNGADSWENAYSQEPPVITYYTPTNYYNYIEGSWSKPEGAYTFKVQYANNPYFTDSRTETTTKTEAKIIIPNGTWYWRVQAVYSSGGSVFSAPVKTYVTPEPIVGGLLALLLAFFYQRKNRAV